MCIRESLWCDYGFSISYCADGIESNEYKSIVNSLWLTFDYLGSPERLALACRYKETSRKTGTLLCTRPGISTNVSHVTETLTSIEYEVARQALQIWVLFLT